MNKSKYLLNHHEAWLSFSNLRPLQQNGMQYLFQEYYAETTSKYQDVYEDVLERLELLGDNTGFNQEQIDAIKKIAILFENFEENKSEISSVLDTCIEENIADSNDEFFKSVLEPTQAFAKEQSFKIMNKSER